MVVPALQEPESVPFNVRAWLYRRASVRSFESSEEALGLCIISVEDDMKNPYDFLRGSRKLGVPFEEFCEENDVEELRMSAALWIRTGMAERLRLSE